LFLLRKWLGLASAVGVLSVAATDLTLRRIPWLVMQSSTTSTSRGAKDRMRAFCIMGTTKARRPVMMRNPVSGCWRFEPEISKASSGAGTYQATLMAPAGALAVKQDDEKKG